MKLSIKDLSPETKQAVVTSAWDIHFESDTEWEDNAPLSLNEWVSVAGVFALAIGAVILYGGILFSV